MKRLPILIIGVIGVTALVAGEAEQEAAKIDHPISFSFWPTIWDGVTHLCTAASTTRHQTLTGWLPLACALPMRMQPIHYVLPLEQAL